LFAIAIRHRAIRCHIEHLAVTLRFAQGGGIGTLARGRRARPRQLATRAVRLAFYVGRGARVVVAELADSRDCTLAITAGWRWLFAAAVRNGATLGDFRLGFTIANGLADIGARGFGGSGWVVGANPLDLTARTVGLALHIGRGTGAFGALAHLADVRNRTVVGTVVVSARTWFGVDAVDAPLIDADLHVFDGTGAGQHCS
jgi:hypothetical protein